MALAAEPRRREHADVIRILIPAGRAMTSLQTTARAGSDSRADHAPDEQQIAAWRADTPGCAHRIHMNNAGAGMMPRPVLDAMHAHLTLEGDIGGYEAAARKAAEIEQVYAEAAALVNAAPRNIAIVANATAGFIQALTTFDFAAGDVLVTSQSDYTSNQIQYLALSRRLGIEVLYAEDLPEGGADPDSVRRLARHPRCRLVAISWVPTHSGLVQDVEEIGRVCEEVGVPFLVDAVQAIGQIPIDVTRVRCDYLSVTARKFLRGPRGIGFLYASDRALSRGDYPLFVDMRGATWTSENAFEVAESARRFEDWEFPYALVLGMGAALRYARTVGVDVAGRRAFALAARLREGLRTLPGARVLDRGRNPCAIVTVELPGVHGSDAVAALWQHGINTAATLRWFGLRDLTPRGVESAVRISPHYYNTENEVDTTIAALHEIIVRAAHGREHGAAS
jgi:selenocysteine lyase/cysteine desulfurase